MPGIEAVKLRNVLVRGAVGDFQIYCGGAEFFFGRHLVGRNWWGTFRTGKEVSMMRSLTSNIIVKSWSAVGSIAGQP